MSNDDNSKSPLIKALDRLFGPLEEKARAQKDEAEARANALLQTAPDYALDKMLLAAFREIIRRAAIHDLSCDCGKKQVAGLTEQIQDTFGEIVEEVVNDPEVKAAADEMRAMKEAASGTPDGFASMVREMFGLPEDAEVLIMGAPTIE